MVRCSLSVVIRLLFAAWCVFFVVLAWLLCSCCCSLSRRSALVDNVVLNGCWLLRFDGVVVPIVGSVGCRLFIVV